jgi:hypothetical protein
MNPASCHSKLAPTASGEVATGRLLLVAADGLSRGRAGRSAVAQPRWHARQRCGSRRRCRYSTAVRSRRGQAGLGWQVLPMLAPGCGLLPE